MIKLTDVEFIEFIRFMHSNYGIDLSKKKQLIEGRLSNMVESKGMKSFSEYIHSIKRNDKDEISMLINKLTTNYTYFYREENHFKYLREVILPFEEQTNKSKTISIWSAGCSSGEEPYTLAMIINDYFKLKRLTWRVEILATDISQNVLDKAREAVYTEDCIKNLPQLYKTRFFKKIEEKKYEVIPEIKNQITFKTFNLMKPIVEKNKYNVIFCRNVMIYFNAATKIELVNKFYQANQTGGYLMIGHAETIQRGQSNYKYICPAIYKKE
jgi:chemotaxis protein methyltransferase CheR